MKKKNKKENKKKKNKKAILRLILTLSIIVFFILILQEVNQPKRKAEVYDSYFDGLLNQKIRDCYALRANTLPVKRHYEEKTFMDIKTHLRSTNIPEEEVRFRKCPDTFSTCMYDSIFIEYESQVYMSIFFDEGICYIDFEAQ